MGNTCYNICARLWNRIFQRDRCNTQPEQAGDGIPYCVVSHRGLSLARSCGTWLVVVEIGYDWALRGMKPEGLEVTCYSNNILVTARGNNFHEVAILATVGVTQVVNWIQKRWLKVALNKSEALCYHGTRKSPPVDSSIMVEGVPIAVRKTVKYLRLVLDSKWRFWSYFEQLSPKLLRVAARNSFSRMLPNSPIRGTYLGGLFEKPEYHRTASTAVDGGN